jgi:peptide/nickel transport system permease protein
VERFGFLGARLLQLLPVALGITILTFFLLRLVPGDPAAAILGTHYTPEAASRLDKSLGLDKPIFVQYLYFMKNVLHGDFGVSITYDSAVLPLIIHRMAPTFFLALYAATLAALIALPVAVIAALRKDGIFDQTARGLLLITFGMPSYWVAIIFMLVFSLHLRWFPISGYGSTFLEHLWYLFLPALTIALSFSVVLIRTLRNSVLQVLQAEYVDTARIKGISTLAVLRGHVLRNALLSVVTVFGINLAFLVSGTVIIENIYSIPGMGQMLITAINARDYPVVQGETLIFALLIITINLLTDTVYAILDPRVTYE